MSDSTGAPETTTWHSPSGSQPTPLPAYGEFASPPPPPPFAAVPSGPVPSGPQAWTPPPKPGLIALRPMTLGTILGASFRVLRRNPRPTFGLALLIEGVTLVLSLVAIGAVALLAFGRLANAASSSDAATIANGSVGLILLAYVVPITLSLFGTAIMNGVFSLEVARGTLGEKLTLRGLWRRARGRLGALIGWIWALAGAAILATIILTVIIAVIAAVGSGAGVAVAIVLGILLGLGALVLFAWLYPKLSLVPAALMVERLSLGRAIARSWTLTRGYFWRTLGIELLVAVILNVAVGVITTPFSVILGLVSGLLGQTGSQSTLISVVVVFYIVIIVVSVIFGAVAAVVQATTPALLYIDLRMRKEGLDIDLVRFVEARQAGDNSVADPYLSTSRPAPTTPAWPTPPPPPPPPPPAAP